ncbi:hypothetical protein PR048_023167 [Dryococelus australis]|uniref:DUF1618 domain-containing protein n=1 Tax=Dryococelus australis TaxID=614101 RepID=A0ABQ9GTC4_9NEOP|nr:hypothetical protein PR048_023167 [Dryococelus australis]
MTIIRVASSLPCLPLSRGRDGVVVRLLASHQGKACSITGGVAPRFLHVGVVPGDATARLTLIGSQDFDIKSRPNIFIQFSPFLLPGRHSGCSTSDNASEAEATPGSGRVNDLAVIACEFSGHRLPRRNSRCEEPSGPAFSDGYVRHGRDGKRLATMQRVVIVVCDCRESTNWDIPAVVSFRVCNDPAVDETFRSSSSARHVEVKSRQTSYLVVLELAPGRCVGFYLITPCVTLPASLSTDMARQTWAQKPGHSGFSHVGIVPDDAIGRRVFSRISASPAPSFRRCPILTATTLIGSEDFDVKRPRPCSLYVGHLSYVYMTPQRTFSRLNFWSMEEAPTWRFQGNRAAVAERSDYSPPIWANQVRFPAGPLLDFSHVGIVSDDAAGRRAFFRGTPVSPVLAFQRCSVFTSLHPHRLSRRRCQQPPKSLHSLRETPDELHELQMQLQQNCVGVQQHGSRLTNRESCAVCRSQSDERLTSRALRSQSANGYAYITRSAMPLHLAIMWSGIRAYSIYAANFCRDMGAAVARLLASRQDEQCSIPAAGSPGFLRVVNVTDVDIGRQTFSAYACFSCPGIPPLLSY